MEHPHPERERGRSRRRSQSFRKPFQAFKSILARKLRLDRSDSRDRSPPPSFTHGTIEHAHSVPVDPTDIPLYLPIHIDLSGAIITPEESVKIGTVVCNCDSPSVPNTLPSKFCLLQSRLPSYVKMIIMLLVPLLYQRCLTPTVGPTNLFLFFSAWIPPVSQFYLDARWGMRFRSSI